MISDGKIAFGPVVPAAPLPSAPFAGVAQMPSVVSAMPADVYVNGWDAASSGPACCGMKFHSLAMMWFPRRKASEVSRTPHLIDCLRNARSDARREAISLLTATALDHYGHVGSIVRALDEHKESPHGRRDRAELVRSLQTIRRRFPRDIGSILGEAREKSGLRRVDMLQMAKIDSPNLSAIEQGRQDLSIETLFRFCRALYDHLNLASVYEAVNPDVRDIEAYNSARGVYTIILPKGLPSEALFDLPPADYINEVLQTKGLKPANICKSAGISEQLFEHMRAGANIYLSLEQERRLAVALKEPFDIFYLRLHPELRFFLKIALSAGDLRVISSPSKGNFENAGGACLRKRPPATKGDAFIERVMHSISKGERDAVDTILKRDPSSGAIYIELPEPWTVGEIGKIDNEWVTRRLYDRVMASPVGMGTGPHAAGKGYKKYLPYFGTNYGTFQEMVRGHRFPTEGVLSKLAQALDLPPQVIALWLRPEWVKEVEIRAPQSTAGTGGRPRAKSGRAATGTAGAGPAVPPKKNLTRPPPKPPLPANRIPLLARILYESRDPRLRGGAVQAMGVIAIDYPQERNRIFGILKDWQTMDPDAGVRKYIDEVLGMI